LPKRLVPPVPHEDGAPAEGGVGQAGASAMLRHADGGALAQRTYMDPTARAIDFIDDALRNSP
jgi:hypothetical protein